MLTESVKAENETTDFKADHSNLETETRRMETDAAGRVDFATTALAAADFSQLLQQYYMHLFPFSLFHRWLSYGSVDTFRKNYFANREFSFTLQNDVWTRYQSFDSVADLKSVMLKLIPQRIEIGAVFTAKPRDSKSIKKSSYFPVEKELVFDIDMDAYDDIRLCCSGAKVCEKCWKFLAVAIKVVDRALREDFGFKHLLWVYSGRRGVHCWVCDDRARMLTTEMRASVAEYLCLIKGGGKKLIMVDNLHPSIKRAIDIMHPYFESCILEGQDILCHSEGIKKLLSFVPDEGIRELYGRKWSDNDEDDTSTDRWKDFLEEVRLVQAKTKSKMFKSLEMSIILQYLYPRLDIEVSKQINHLLKSPFCVHPSTGRICVPIDPERAFDFNPNEVPTIYQLFNELEGSSVDMDEDNNASLSPGEKSEPGMRALGKEYRKTSLASSIEIFRLFVRDLEESVKMLKRKQREEDASF